MVKKLGPKAASVTIQEMGTNCWLPKRFIEGKRCCRVMECSYPEKNTCKAVDAEINRLEGIAEGIQAQIEQLLRERI